MERLCDFADCYERVGSGLFDFKRLFREISNEPDESVQYWQRDMRRLAFGRLQGFNYICSVLGIAH